MGRSSTFVIALAVLMLLIASASAQVDSVGNSPWSGGCRCPTSYNPVCGSDGRTYVNRCEFNCAERYRPGLRLRHDGRCIAGAQQNIPS